MTTYLLLFLLGIWLGGFIVSLHWSITEACENDENPYDYLLPSLLWPGFIIMLWCGHFKNL